MPKHTGTLEHFNETTREYEVIGTIQFSDHLGEIHQEWRRNVVHGEGFYRARWNGQTLFGLDHPEDSGY